VPNAVASMLQQCTKHGFVAHVGNSAKRNGDLIVYIAGLAVCEAHHIYALPGPCPDCATSGTSSVQEAPA